MNLILDSLKRDNEYTKLVPSLKVKGTYLVSGMCDAMNSVMLASLFHDTGRKAVAIFPDEKDATAVVSELQSFGVRGLFLPPRDMFLGKVDARGHEFDYLRLSVLSQVAGGDWDIVATTAEALCQTAIPHGILTSPSVELSPGKTVSIEALCADFLDMGYKRCELVEGKGQFSTRGGIVDVFPSQLDFPLRIEFFGDEIDTVSAFDIMTQRRIDTLRRVSILPAQEIYADRKAKERLASTFEKLSATEKRAEVKEALRAQKEKLENTGIIDFELYTDIIYERAETFADYLTDDCLLCLFETPKLRDRLDSSCKLAQEAVEGLCQSHPELWATGSAVGQRDYGYLKDLVSEKTALVFNGFVTGEDFKYRDIFRIESRKTVSMAQNADLFFDDVEAFVNRGYRVAIISANTISASNLVDSLNSRSLHAHTSKPDGEWTEGSIAVMSVMDKDKTVIALRDGFELVRSGFVLLTDQIGRAEVRASRRHKVKYKSSSKERIMSYNDLEVGDYVVHVNHGIGIYNGIKSMIVDNVQKDYLVIKYAADDVLYLPCNNLDSISKYIGGGAEGSVKLNRLGSAEWKKAKSRARAAASDVAKELIKLYAQRRAVKGHAFSEDTPWQAEFEGAFEYDETDGQLLAVEEIKRDMESEVPMDRLLCGDVGFGKTEVALRGLFKCIMDSMQAAVLAPTTVLAWQHYNTILSRFRGFPVKVALLSRFSTRAEIKTALEGIKEGTVDIVVGTHRLLQKDVEFKRLGFLVVDEEQRFGVTHKEKLKEISKGVDVLTLTATPIPRTLNMALSGIRDMSLLEEAPGDRFPVQTYVMEFDEATVYEAIRREVRRGGQVFYLINNTELLDGRATRIINNVDGVTVATAHGHMDKDELSEIWRDMYDGKIDVLVCTTIIETGVDVPNANTLIIEDADRYGLSQLHQIRGRVGRSSRKAWAYLTYRKNKVLTEIAEKRLSAIKEYTEFGSGFKIAMRDLEIRGAGNLLGSEQHGHMDSVGYDLYIRMLDEAMKLEKGETVEVTTDSVDTLIDLSVDAFLPHSYISSEKIRIDIYKKIAELETEDDIFELTDELIDRFGEPSRAVMNLINISKLRRAMSRLNITKVVQNGESVYIYTDVAHLKPCEAMCVLWKNKLTFRSSAKPFFLMKTDKKNVISDLELFVTDYAEVILRFEENCQ
ncbi:MAG: transcription-repair coupling factor [Clostridia bacterium]|nr:transcription-repair coupling factor [Clostridia bacterium]